MRPAEDRKRDLQFGDSSQVFNEGLNLRVLGQFQHGSLGGQRALLNLGRFHRGASSNAWSKGELNLRVRVTEQTPGGPSNQDRSFLVTPAADSFARRVTQENQDQGPMMKKMTLTKRRRPSRSKVVWLSGSLLKG